METSQAKEQPKKKSLYNITAEQMAMMQEIEQMDGEVTPEMEEALTLNTQELEMKSIAYLAVIKKTESFNKDIDEEIKRLQTLKKRGVTLIDRLKGSLLTYVKLNGVFETKFNKFGTRKSTTVIITDSEVIPHKFRTKKVTVTPDKTAIKEALKSGKKVKGAELQENQLLKIN